VQFIDQFAFANVKIDSISIEAGNTTFEMMIAFLIDIVSHKLIRSFSCLVEHGKNFELSSQSLGVAWISTCFSLGVHHGAFSDHPENVGSDERSAA
jgi:hypothetical protein